MLSWCLLLMDAKGKLNLCILCLCHEVRLVGFAAFVKKITAPLRNWPGEVGTL